jgi:hypothetical protein
MRARLLLMKDSVAQKKTHVIPSEARDLLSRGEDEDPSLRSG